MANFHFSPAIHFQFHHQIAHIYFAPSLIKLVPAFIHPLHHPSIGTSLQVICGSRQFQPKSHNLMNHSPYFFMGKKKRKEKIEKDKKRKDSTRKDSVAF